MNDIIEYNHGENISVESKFFLAHESTKRQDFGCFSGDTPLARLLKTGNPVPVARDYPFRYVFLIGDMICVPTFQSWKVKHLFSKKIDRFAEISGAFNAPLKEVK